MAENPNKTNDNAESEACSIWVKWDKKFELGIPRIDKQHQHLVSLCNNLHDVLMHPQDGGKEAWRKAISEALRKAVAYTKSHFGDEEKLMQICHFSGYEAHKQRHQEFVLTLTKVLNDFDDMSLTIGFDFADYLRDWILTHVACEDKLYCPVVRAFYTAFKQQQASSGSGQ
jgi:hemerythrin-like metal-binding domain